MAEAREQAEQRAQAAALEHAAAVQRAGEAPGSLPLRKQRKQSGRTWRLAIFAAGVLMMATALISSWLDPSSGTPASATTESDISARMKRGETRLRLDRNVERFARTAERADRHKRGSVPASVAPAGKL